MSVEELKKKLTLLVDCGRYPKLYGKATEKRVKREIVKAFKSKGN